jgi:hypothetical protein
MSDNPQTIAEPRRSRCLYRREGQYWWRVDADITESGALVVTSGDSNEWLVIVGAADVPSLLRVLRREGDLTAAVGGDAADELLARLADRFGPAGSGILDRMKDFLAAQRIPFESQFWAGDRDD